MIAVFTAVNGLYLSKQAEMEWNWTQFFLTFILLLSFFFRMRLFDEIKDYEVDLKINPTRPLARGILSVIQVKKALLLLIIFELILAAFVGGWNSFIVHGLAIGYSLLMYEEFFIGDFLRPHLTTYAVTHTFSSFLLAISAGVAMTGISITDFHADIYIFFLMNWAFFNLFEFARKTFAVSEERPGVLSYSNIFGRTGAWLLSTSQAAIGIILVSSAKIEPLVIAAFVLYLAASSLYLIQGNAKAAKIFRNSSAAYLLVHYIIVIYVLGAS
ncbi:manganese transporter permease [Bdellovibrio bacteriovorus]|uniref:Manganese transporter permease n=2 Tax=Bdellovibrio bacteriovorus TaxID=959 RepID=A0A150WSF6_BDEBC|nr:manganese transporter permease [Bdellovibrio bacteriovorus]